MVKPELGTKRICPETGRKFYDLNRDPIVSPYTGQSYPRSYFEDGTERQPEVEKEEVVAEKETPEEGPEIVSLEDADKERKGSDSDLPDIEEEDVELGEEDDDAFLADEEEAEDDDVKDIIGVGEDDED